MARIMYPNGVTREENHWLYDRSVEEMFRKSRPKRLGNLYFDTRIWKPEIAAARARIKAVIAQMRCPDEPEEAILALGNKTKRFAERKRVIEQVLSSAPGDIINPTPYARAAILASHHDYPRTAIVGFIGKAASFARGLERGIIAVSAMCVETSRKSIGLKGAASVWLVPGAPPEGHSLDLSFSAMFVPRERGSSFMQQVRDWKKDSEAQRIDDLKVDPRYRGNEKARRERSLKSLKGFLENCSPLHPTMVGDEDFENMGEWTKLFTKALLEEIIEIPFGSIIDPLKLIYFVLKKQFDLQFSQVFYPYESILSLYTIIRSHFMHMDRPPVLIVDKNKIEEINKEFGSRPTVHRLNQKTPYQEYWIVP